MAESAGTAAAAGRVRLCLASLVALVPVGRLRIALYRRLLGFAIGEGCRIGMFNLLACRSLSLGAGSVIGRGNLMKGDFDFAAGPRMFIGNFNVLTCPWGLGARRAEAGYGTSVRFGADCLINDRHFLDAHGRITVGDGTWIAGRDSQFYTHGISVAERDIAVGRGCFIGSAVRFAPGSGVGDGCVVGMGSVVVGRVAAEAALVAGFPARPIRDISAAREAGAYRFSKDDWGSA